MENHPPSSVVHIRSIFILYIRLKGSCRIAIKLKFSGTPKRKNTILSLK